MKYRFCLLWRAYLSSLLVAIAPMCDRVAPAYANEPTTVETPVNSTSYNGVATKIDRIAQQITVRIDSLKNGNGSGVIVAKQGNSYYVLTANHVVKNPDEYTLVTPDGEKYPLQPNAIQTFEGVDIALVRFSSSKAYSVATLGDYSTNIYDERLAFLSGFPALKSGTPTRKFTAGIVFLPERAIQAAQSSFSLTNGYELIYTNLSQRGMSGGPVLDNLGRVIGINTASEAELEVDNSGQTIEIQLGNSLGVPIRTFLGLLAKTPVDAKWLKRETNLPPILKREEINTIRQSVFSETAPSATANEIEWLNWGNNLRRIGKYQEALAALDKALQIKPDFALVYYSKGYVFYSQKKYAQAAAEFQKATQIDPNFFEAWDFHSAALTQLNKPSEALVSIDKAIQLQPDDPNLSLSRATVLASTGRLEETVSATTKALELKPSYVGYILRGTTRSSLGDIRGAIADYTNAIALLPSDYNAYNLRGGTYTYMGERKAAMTDINKAIALAPAQEQPDVYVSRARIRVLDGDTKGALADLKVALSLNPDYVDAYKDRVSLLQKLGDESGAQADAKKAIELYTQQIAKEPENILLYLERATVRSDIFALSEAEADLKAAKQLSVLPQNHSLAKTMYPLKVITLANAYWQRGFNRENAGYYKAAIADYNRSIELAPDYALAYKQRASVRDKLKDTQGARADRSKALALYTQQITFFSNPKNKTRQTNGSTVWDNGFENTTTKLANAYSGRGSIYTDLKDYQKALADYNKAIELEPNNARYSFFYSGRGWLYQTLKQYDKAIADYSKGIELDPNMGMFYFDRGNVYSDLKQYDKAIADYTKTIKLEPNDVSAYSARGLVYEKSKNYQRAIADYTKLIELQPNQSWHYAARARIYNYLEDYAKVIADFSSAIALEPKNDGFYNSRGLAYYFSQDYQKALADFSSAIELLPNNFNYYLERGIVYSSLKDYRNAIADFSSAIELEPNNSQLYSNRGFAYFFSQDYQRAIADFSSAIKLEPNNAQLYSNRGNIYSNSGDYQNAIADANKVISLQPDNANAYFARGVIYQKQGNYNAALADYNLALTKDKNYWVAINNIGFIKYEKGNVDEAIQQWQKSIAIAPKAAESQLALAIALYSKGEQAQGIEMAKKALKIDNNLGKLDYLKKNLWGDRILSDTQKLFQEEAIQAML
jgi:tetratricopeptide (TPR) repeat protein